MDFFKRCSKDSPQNSVPQISSIGYQVWAARVLDFLREIAKKMDKITFERVVLKNFNCHFWIPRGKLYVGFDQKISRTFFSSDFSGFKIFSTTKVVLSFQGLKDFLQDLLILVIFHSINLFNFIQESFVFYIFNFKHDFDSFWRGFKIIT